ncbi:hypothetical protein BS17DRAFT_777612 [Gyrodon lividus]|nr:hypothetical protein BS17DRAFT_777612 [Gyrodon lividus]
MSSCSIACNDIPYSDIEIQALQSQIGCLSEQINLLTVQSAIVHERRRIIRERRSIQPLSLPFLVIQGSFLEMEETPVDDVKGGGPYNNLYQDGDKSRFSHSLTSSPATFLPPTTLMTVGRKPTLATVIYVKLRSLKSANSVSAISSIISTLKRPFHCS